MGYGYCCAGSPPCNQDTQMRKIEEKKMNGETDKSTYFPENMMVHTLAGKKKHLVMYAYFSLVRCLPTPIRAAVRKLIAVQSNANGRLLKPHSCSLWPHNGWGFGRRKPALKAPARPPIERQTCTNLTTSVHSSCRIPGSHSKGRLENDVFSTQNSLNVDIVELVSTQTSTKLLHTIYTMDVILTRRCATRIMICDSRSAVAARTEKA